MRQRVRENIFFNFFFFVLRPSFLILRCACPIFAVTCATAALAGCGASDPGKEKEPGIVEYMTGAQDLKMYQETKNKIEGINKTLQERNSEE